MITDETVSLSDGVGQVTFDILAYVADADYSWSAEAVLRRQADGALFYVEDGGCSCNGFGEYIDVSDLKPIRRVEDALKLTGDRENMQRSIDQSESIYR
jgi:hypothetical protein